MEFGKAETCFSETISALAKGMRVLSSFKNYGLALGNKEIAQRTGLPRSTISRLTYTLAALGYLRYDPDSARYSLAPYALTIAKPILRRGSTVKGLLHPLLQEHADRMGTWVGLGTVHELSVLYVDVCGAGGLGLKVGGRLPLARSAIGRALFAAMNGAEREECLAKIRTAFQPAAASKLIEDLLQAVDDVARVGFCNSEGDLSEAVRGIGVPLRLRQGGTVFAINCGGPQSSVSPQRLNEVIGPATVALANRIASTPLTLPSRH